MSVTLIITRSLDKNHQKTGKIIKLDEWLNLVQQDPALSIRIEPYTTANPRDGSTISISAPPGQTDLLVQGKKLPFLAYRGGNLITRFHPDMESVENPLRRKITEISRKLDALIMHDAGDEILEWRGGI
jgi:hypothetical protein